MNNNIFKYIKYLSYLMLVLGLGVFIYFIIASTMYPEQSMEFPVGTVGNAMGVNVMLIYTYIIFAISVVVALVFPLINIVTNPKGAMRTLIGLVAMVVIFGISYLLASDEPIANPAVNGFFDNPMVLKLTDVGLFATYAVLLISFAVIIWGEVRSAIKRS